MLDTKILCVDDESQILDALRRELMGECGTFLTAPSAEAGLEILERETVNVVISDMRMPKMDGAEFLQLVRHSWPGVFRILLTGFADMETVIRSINKGEVHRFIAKPWNPDNLIDVIREGCDRALLQQAKNALTEELAARNRELDDLNRDLDMRVKERTLLLEKAYVELARTEKLASVGRLAAGVVHEVLNPLTVARGRLEMALFRPDADEEIARHMNLAIGQIDRGVEILDNLRDFSKQKPLKREETDFNELLGHSLELVAHELKRKGVSVETDFGSLSLILVDRGQFAQVFLNLINNALDAMPLPGTLTVTSKMIDREDESWVEISIADTGEGIAEEDLMRIFDPFFTSKETGTGLGLAICFGIVESHGGRITVDSEPGNGTSFTIQLPRTL
jgi:two-component system, NtrC family, sensor kinase